MEDKQVIKELIDKYPFLLPRNVWTDKEIEDYDYSWCLFKNEIPDGWWDRWGLIYLDDLKEVLEKYDFLDKFRFSQVKEKFGGLRAYNNGAPEEWFSHEYAWEYISEHTCVKCGKFPSKMRYDYWISPWCDKCFGSQETLVDMVHPDELTIDEDDRLLEYLEIGEYSRNGFRNKLIDMKPYYKKIGWEFTDEDLISREEAEELYKKREEETLSVLNDRYERVKEKNGEKSNEE